MSIGKISALLAIVPLLLVCADYISFSRDDGISGPLIKVYEYLFGSNAKPVQVELSPISWLTIYESKLRVILQAVAIIISVFSGILAVRAARFEESSLWYSVAIFLAAAGLTEISYLLAIFYMGVFAVLVLWARNWKMTNE
jgi:hypothetical protein